MKRMGCRGEAALAALFAILAGAFGLSLANRGKDVKTPRVVLGENYMPWLRPTAGWSSAPVYTFVDEVHNADNVATGKK